MLNPDEPEESEYECAQKAAPSGTSVGPLLGVAREEERPNIIPVSMMHAQMQVQSTKSDAVMKQSKWYVEKKGKRVTQNPNDYAKILVNLRRLRMSKN